VSSFFLVPAWAMSVRSIRFEHSTGAQGPASAPVGFSHSGRPTAIGRGRTSDRGIFVPSLWRTIGLLLASAPISKASSPRGRNEHGRENGIAKSGLCVGRRRDACLRRPDVRADARHGAAPGGTDREAGVQRRRRENPSGMPPGEAPYQAGRAARQDPRGARAAARAMTATRRRRPTGTSPPARSLDRRRSTPDSFAEPRTDTAVESLRLRLIVTCFVAPNASAQSASPRAPIPHRSRSCPTAGCRKCLR
jgi:hypothetical protein